jgi:large subunit ribosomal protein L17
MRHRKNTVKLGRSQAHRDAMLANQVVSLIEHSRIKTTLAKAKAVRPFAEKMLTLGKRGDLHARRLAVSYLGQKDAVKKLFDEVAPRAAARTGGYTRIIKLGPRQSDSAPMAYIEWVDAVVEAEVTVVEEAKPAKKASAKKAAPAAIEGETTPVEAKPAKKPAAKKKTSEE